MTTEREPRYEVMPVEPFGRALLRTLDLDPIYVALVRMGDDMGEDQVKRWLVAYWCLYHAGVASYLSQYADRKFWAMLDVAARNEVAAPTGGRWDRGKERRHWRGAQAVTSAAFLQEQHRTPELFVDYVAGSGGDFQYVARRARQHQGFGPWIAFKMADMLERVLGAPIDFHQAEVFMFKDPKQAALMVHEHWRSGAESELTEAERISEVVEVLTQEFSNWKAPPTLDRAVGLQEVETILCKWKSHTLGHYPPGNDIEEIREGLPPWAEHSRAARAFLEAMPSGGQEHGPSEERSSE